MGTELNHKARDTYSPTVTVSDRKDISGDPDTLIDEAITVTDVDEPPLIAGPTDVRFPENHSGPVGSYLAYDPESLQSNSWDIGGPDADYFEYRFSARDGSASPAFRTPPDYENPGDANQVSPVQPQEDATTPLPRPRSPSRLGTRRRGP